MEFKDFSFLIRFSGIILSGALLGSEDGSRPFRLFSWFANVRIFVRMVRLRRVKGFATSNGRFTRYHLIDKLRINQRIIP